MTDTWLEAGWMQTYTGKQFFPTRPRIEDIDIRDIAHALSMICRYGGHVDRFYSVAEHCILMSQAVSPENALWALLHDATEAYVGDMVRPLKYTPGLELYREIEDNLMLLIAEKFGLSGGMPAEVHEADNRILLNERRALMKQTPADWVVEGLEPLDTPIYACAPHMAEHWYLDRFRQLSHG
jgi:hypothetical protein